MRLLSGPDTISENFRDHHAVFVRYDTWNRFWPGQAEAVGIQHSGPAIPPVQLSDHGPKEPMFFEKAKYRNYKHSSIEEGLVEHGWSHHFTENTKNKNSEKGPSEVHQLILGPITTIDLQGELRYWEFKNMGLPE